METFVIGVIERNLASHGNMQGVMTRLSPVGYEFREDPEHYEFNKLGRIESVITEMVPVCEDHGLDVEDFQLVEYSRNSGEERCRYHNGRIIRE